MWIYVQKSGELLREEQHVAYGYSGYEEGKNNPAMQDRPNLGPIPQGRYRIGAPHDSVHVGPFALALSPAEGTNTFGRDSFLIHGDSVRTPGTASHGCIIVARWVREQIDQSGDRELLVREA